MFRLYVGIENVPTLLGYVCAFARKLVACFLYVLCASVANKKTQPPSLTATSATLRPSALHRRFSSSLSGFLLSAPATWLAP